MTRVQEYAMQLFTSGAVAVLRPRDYPKGRDAVVAFRTPDGKPVQVRQQIRVRTLNILWEQGLLRQVCTNGGITWSVAK